MDYHSLKDIVRIDESGTHRSASMISIISNSQRADSPALQSSPQPRPRGILKKTNAHSEDESISSEFWNNPPKNCSTRPHNGRKSPRYNEHRSLDIEDRQRQHQSDNFRYSLDLDEARLNFRGLSPDVLREQRPFFMEHISPSTSQENRSSPVDVKSVKDLRLSPDLNIHLSGNDIRDFRRSTSPGIDIRETPVYETRSLPRKGILKNTEKRRYTTSPNNHLRTSDENKEDEIDLLDYFTKGTPPSKDLQTDLRSHAPTNERLLSDCGGGNERLVSDRCGTFDSGIGDSGDQWAGRRWDHERQNSQESTSRRWDHERTDSQESMSRRWDHERTDSQESSMSLGSSLWGGSVERPDEVEDRTLWRCEKSEEDPSGGEESSQASTIIFPSDQNLFNMITMQEALDNSFEKRLNDNDKTSDMDGRLNDNNSIDGRLSNCSFHSNSSRRSNDILSNSCHDYHYRPSSRGSSPVVCRDHESNDVTHNRLRYNHQNRQRHRMLPQQPTKGILKKNTGGPHASTSPTHDLDNGRLIGDPSESYYRSSSPNPDDYGVDENNPNYHSDCVHRDNSFLDDNTYQNSVYLDDRVYGTSSESLHRDTAQSNLVLNFLRPQIK